MTPAELAAIRARAYAAAAADALRCVHGREPFDRCEVCSGEDSVTLLVEVERLNKANYEEVWDHAACLSIAEGVPLDGFVPTRPSQRAVLALRAEVERLREALGAIAGEGCIRQWVADPDCRAYALAHEGELKRDEWCFPCQAREALADGHQNAKVAPGTTQTP